MNIQNLTTALTKLSQREKIILYGTVVFVSLAMLDRVVIAPSFSKIKSRDEEIRERQLIIKKDLAIVALKENIEQEAKKYEEYFSKTVSLDEARTSVLKEIENLASQSKVYLVYIRPGETVIEGPFKHLLFNVSCEGRMLEMINFLHSIESSAKLLTVEKYVISPKEEKSSAAQCRMTVSKIIMP